MRDARGVTSVLRAALVRVPLAVGIVLATLLLVAAFSLLYRYEQARRGLGGVDSGVRPQAAYAETAVAAGRYEIEAALTFFETGAREAVAPLVWDDAWAVADPYIYNHELARTASVLSSLAYAESGHYQSGADGPAYMEEALHGLGFTEVSTESYRYRSEIVDQVLNVFTSEEDSVAYAMARKRVAVGDETRSVIVVAVRGSYGAEWVSNLYLHDERSVAEGIEGYHRGYSDAANEIYAALEPWVRESHARGDAVTVVLTGHSRGGAIANIVAAMADGELAGCGASGEGDAAAAGAEAASCDAADAPDVPMGLASGDAVCAYTFASPGCTTSASASDARYNNIFNIANPADMMTYLPLFAWGYERYGVDIELPGLEDEAFAERFEAFCVSYEQLVGADAAGEGSPYNPENEQAVRSVIDDVSAKVASVSELTTPGGVASVVRALVAHIDPFQILHGHYQSVYVAWMLAIDEDVLA